MQFCLHEAGFGGFECRSHRSSSLRLFAVSRERQSRSNTDEHVSRSSDGSSKTNKIRAEHLPRRSPYEQSKQQSHHRDNSSGEANVDGNGAARGKNLRTRHIPHLMSDGSDSQSHGSDRPHHSLDRFLAGLSQSRKGTSAQTLQPADLFPKSNISRLPPLLILYFPFGVIIAGLRMAIWLVLLLVDQPWLTDNNLSIAILQTVLGVDVRWYNAQNIPKARHVLVSNHVTTGDMMMLYKLPRKTIHLISSTVPQRVTKVKNHRIQFRHASVASYDSLAKDKVSHSIHLFPEGGMTNGNGMMKFNRGFMRFSEGLCVVPVALQATLPWDIRTHTLTSSFLSNMFWFCFSPFVRLELTVLPPVRQNQRLGESKAAFVERIQQKIALELDIPILDFTLQAKKQLIKSAGRKVHH